MKIGYCGGRGGTFGFSSAAYAGILLFMRLPLCALLSLSLGLLPSCSGVSSAHGASATTVVCTTDDEKSLAIGDALDAYASGDLEVFADLHASGVRFYWGTREPAAAFGAAEWRSGIVTQQRLFKDIVLVDRQITTGRYPDGNTWTAVWCEWTGRNSVTDTRSKYLLHLSYKWDGDKVAEEYGFFDATRYQNELKAAGF